MPDTPPAIPHPAIIRDTASPFARLRTLLDDIAPPVSPIHLDIGSPRHPPPAAILESLAQDIDYVAYPPVAGIAEFHNATRAWVVRRFNIAADFLAELETPLPLCGTREGLFLAAQITPQIENGYIFMPDPFYQLYATAAQAAGATPLYGAANKQNNFFPDLDALDEKTLSHLRGFYLCNPTNPQGTSATRTYLRHAYMLAKKYNFLLLVDECYSDIYDENSSISPPISSPISMLEIMAEENDIDAPVLVFHSLSKRSNLAGLRSGFALGGRTAHQHFHALRLIAGTQSPVPHQRAAALAWADDAHVIENRALYKQKLDCAETILAGQFEFYRPAGGFFLWLNVGTENGETFAQTLWRNYGVRVLPGAYLAAVNQDAAAYIRVALVAPLEETKKGLEALCLAAERVAA